LQAIWTLIMVALHILPLILTINNAPLFVAAFMIHTSMNINKLKAQKITKCMLYYTLFRSFAIFGIFVYYILQVSKVVPFFKETRSQVAGWTFLFGINSIIELITVYLTLQVLRYTNQYIQLLNKKMSCDDETEGGLQINC